MPSSSLVEGEVEVEVEVRVKFEVEVGVEVGFLRFEFSCCLYFHGWVVRRLEGNA